MLILEIISPDISPFLSGFVVRRSRSKTSFLAGDRSRYSQDLKPIMQKLLSKGNPPTAKIWLGDPQQKEGELIGTIQSILNRKFPPPYLHLYHGTSSDRLPQILQHGLIPQNKENRVWNQGEDITVREDAIYLTAVKAQAEYYAREASCGRLARGSAAMKASTSGAKPVILEIIIKEPQYKLLIPDDDYIEDKNSGEIDWKTSLSYYGQVAFVGSIPPKQIRVIATGLGAKQHSQ